MVECQIREDSFSLTILARVIGNIDVHSLIRLEPRTNDRDKALAQMNNAIREFKY